MEDPITRFGEWFAEAKQCKAIIDATAVTLATATASGVPSARIVLLKAHDARGFVFYTNLGSRKSGEIKENPNAALCFHWPPLEKQIRIEGRVTPVADGEADTYFGSRPLRSRIGAYASRQSQPLDSRATLAAKVAGLEKVYTKENPPPRPPFWSGWRVVPHAVEFWHEGESRLHDRFRYEREDGEAWRCTRLYP